MRVTVVLNDGGCYKGRLGGVALSSSLATHFQLHVHKQELCQHKGPSNDLNMDETPRSTVTHPAHTSDSSACRL